jgi:predicted transcriptional regulator
MVNRDRHEITIEILKKASGGKKKTEIMRDVGLSYMQAKQYLNELLKEGLLVPDHKHNFRTTRKGLEFLEKCAKCPLFKWDLERIGFSHAR